ncbi:MAG: sulfurtransferase [Alphaproteobacteria bacterium 64-11]|mgnify:CR=1 FL=1|nr:rhodanese-like domain-containing protein [Alphaproteobacteria bacterium]OJU12211.1 MAG: sulfurtransferase [Alphaproteobacteria bacterium 64-11]
MVSPSSSEYAGDVTPQEAWETLNADPRAQLIDVRTFAEWNFVGLPDLSALGRRVHCVEWQTFPSGAPNADFVELARAALAGAGVGADSPVLLLCRSGARSRAAAIALTGAGFERCFNVAQGFEGDRDEQGHRGSAGGWKAAGLPWRQN